MEALPAGRLLIERVILNNFKSYAGVKEIGPFHKNFTSVVGPNGSGKSNLLESLLFAFGKRARKMRLKKLSDLIHRSHLHPNLKEASVEVHFINIIDNGDDFEIVPGSKMVLSRIVRHNNTSEYRLNNRVSTYEEVTETLKHRGIDLEQNRFLILQGEVEHIAMMKPKAESKDDSKSGLLEYLEEIIGTDKYIPAIEAAEKELETIGDEVTSKKMRFEEARKAFEELEQPMKEAVSYIELEKECFCFKSLKVKLELFQGTKRLEEVHECINKHEETLKEIDQKYKQKKKDNEESIKEFQERANELQALDRELESLKNGMKKICDEDQKKLEALKKVKNSVESCKKDLELDTKRCSEIEKGIQESLENLPRLDAEIKRIKELKDSVYQEYAKVKAEIDQHTEGLRKRKDAIENELKPHKRELTMTKTEKDTKMHELTNVIQELENGDQEKKECTEKIENLAKMQQALNAEIENLTKNLSDLKQISEELSRKSEVNRSVIVENQNSAGEIQAKIRQIENEEKKISEVRGQFSEILRAKMNKELKGVLGRLGDLGSINPVYDVAISSVCPMLDYIVVESVKNGEDVIEFCRTKKLGRVNIIVIDKINVNQHNMNQFRFSDPKAVRLFDQISFSEERLKSVFYFALGDTLFTDLFDDARRIAFGAQRFKVVTKDGNILNPSGEMRGFANQIKGKMKLNSGRSNRSREDEQNAASLPILMNQLKLVNETLEKAKQEELTINKEQNNLRTKEIELNKSLRSKQNEAKLCSDDLDQKKNRLKILSAKSVSDMQQEKAKLELILAKLSEKIEKTTMLISQKNDSIAEIEKQIDEVGGQNFVELKTRLQSLTTEEEKCESDYSKGNQKLNQLKKDLDKYSKSKEAHEKELESLKEEEIKLKESRAQLETKANKLAEDYKIVSDKLEESQSILEKLEKQKESISKEFQELIDARKKVKAEKEVLIDQCKSIENEIKKWETLLHHILQDYEELKKDYEGLLVNMETEVSQIPALEHQAKKSKLLEDRINLRRPVEYRGSNEEFLALLPKIREVGEIEKSLEQELSVSKPNLRIIEEYKQKKQEKLQKEESLTQVKQQENEIRNRYIDSKNKRFNEFNKGFREISEKLKEMYNLLTRGGNAELEFADTTDPFSEGIVFTVRPPHKSWKKMANLSGGEKTLSSLALVFALHHYKPNALYVMDEVDAALDFQNVGIIANYIKGETKNAQFIVVSLRYQMFEVADQLVGIYKVKDVTQSLSVSPAALKSTQSNNRIIKQTIENISIKQN